MQKVTVDGRPAHWVHRGAKLHVTPAGADRRRDAPSPSTSATRATRGRRRSVWGEVGWEELTDGVLVASQPSGAPTWFPCNDRPDQKAPFRVAVTAAVRLPRRRQRRARARGRVRGSQTTWVYEQPEPMAPYLATLQIGRYESVDVAADPVSV